MGRRHSHHSIARIVFVETEVYLDRPSPMTRNPVTHVPRRPAGPVLIIDDAVRCFFKIYVLDNQGRYGPDAHTVRLPTGR